MTTPSPTKSKDIAKEQGKVAEEVVKKKNVEHHSKEQVNEPPKDTIIAKEEGKIVEETKAPNSPSFIVEDVKDELVKQDYLTNEDIKRILLEVKKDALPLGSPTLMKIIDSPKAKTTPSSPTSMQTLGMPLFPLP